MAYYKLLLVIFIILVISVAIQGKELFRDTFFTVSYVISGFALVAGARYKETSRTSLSIGLILLFSVAFLSTYFLINFCSKPFESIFLFKIAVIISLDVCAILFLQQGRKLGKEEGKEHRLGIYCVE
jgi:phosphatidylserine synthase